MTDKPKHGGNIYKVAKTLKCHPHEIIDFSANTNLVIPKIDLTLTQKQISLYGDPDYKSLYKSIAKRYKVTTTQIALFNGASSAILELFKVLKPKRSYLYTPIYSEYTRAAEHYSQKSTFIDRFQDLYHVPKKNALVVFVNPATPDGKYYDLEKLFKIWMHQKCTIVIDESFLEFTDKPSVRKLISHYKRLYIVHSFTKFYACAGLRVGAIFSHKQNIKTFTLPAWNLSTYDSVYLEHLLKLKQHHILSQSQNHLLYQELRQILKASNLFDKVYKSDANFILTRSDNARKIAKVLLKEKILVRDCHSFDGLDKRYLRFSVKEHPSLHLLKKALHALT